ncbi:glutaredoxin domain-containing protein [Oceanobacillus sp. FSL K6-2867]|uniref:glutaredoxin family protein n=1 Tax=Oceanobacillus sp. FSL K6-2867 TaxID=2954748 RepID=UPI0030D8A97C
MHYSEVTVYVSDNSLKCNQVLSLLDKYNISYKKKNVTANQSFMEELQELNIYGTPATFIDENEPILGYQKSKIKWALGIKDDDPESESKIKWF